MAVKQRILNILISIDQLIYVLLTLGAGNPDETMSAAAWRLEQKGKLVGKIFRPVIDVLFWFDKDHCKTSYESELNKAQDLLEKHSKSINK
jgi:hypothetical protein